MSDFEQTNVDESHFFPASSVHKLSWNQASLNLSQQGKAYVLITIVGVTGSTPRNSGTKMVVSKLILQ